MAGQWFTTLWNRGPGSGRRQRQRIYRYFECNWVSPWGEQHYGYGVLHRIPWEMPKPGFAAYATMTRMLNRSSTLVNPRCQPPSPIADTRSPVRPRVRYCMRSSSASSDHSGPRCKKRGGRATTAERPTGRISSGTHERLVWATRDADVAGDHQAAIATWKVAA